MPERHGVKVSVIDLKGNAFVEYGLQNLSRNGAKSVKTSTKIEARTGKAFNILVKPQIPFPIRENEIASKGAKPGMVTSEHYPRSKSAYDTQPILPKEMGDHGQEDSPTPEPEAPEFATSTAPPFQLAVYVYIDGNTKAECRSVIFLDPADQETFKPRGVRLRGRWETNKDAPSASKFNEQPIRALAWVWNPYGGLDYWLSKLDMNTMAPTIPTDSAAAEVDDLANMMADNEFEEEVQPKAGVIKVVIKRIVLQGAVAPTNHAEAYPRREGEESAPVGTAGPLVTHQTGVQRSKAHEMVLNIVHWDYYKTGEELYAEFQFQYMGREKLVKLGLSQEDGTPLLAGRVQAPGNGNMARSAKKRGAGDSCSGSGAESSNRKPMFHMEGETVSTKMAKLSLRKQNDAVAQRKDGPPLKRQLRPSTMRAREQRKRHATVETDNEL